MHLRLPPRGTVLAALAALCATPALALVPLARGELFAEGALELEYDSNIYVNRSQVSDTIATFTPGLAYVRDAGLLSLKLSAGGEFLRFADNTQLNGEFARFHGSVGWHDEEGKTDADASFGAARTSFASISLNDRSIADRYEFTGKVGHWLSEKFGFNLAADVLDLRSVKGDYSDLRMQQVGLDGRYLLSPKLETLLGYAYRHTDTTNNTVQQIPLTSDDHQFSVGLSGELTGKIKGELRTGYVLRQLDQGSTHRDHSAPFARVGLTWSASEKTAVNFAVRKDFDTSAANQSINKFDTSLGVSHELTAKLRASLSLNYVHDSYIGGASRTDDIIVGGARLEYSFTPQLRASVHATAATDDSSHAVADCSRSTVGVSVNARF